MESNRDLLKEAIADAKAVKETALAQAKVALEEAFTPFLKETLATRIAALDEADEVKEMYIDEEEMYEGDDMKMEEGEELMDEGDDLEENELDLEELLAELDKDSMEEGEDMKEDLYEAEEDEEGEKTEDEEFNIEDMSEQDLTQFIEDVIQDMVASGELEGGQPEMGGEEEMGSEEEINIDELLAEAAKEKMKKKSMPKEDEKEKDKKLKEAYDTIQTLRDELNEINLLNAKLLYTNKIFKAKSLTESEKVKVLSAFDKAVNVKEVKLVYESLMVNGNKTKSSIKESLGSASKVISKPETKQPIIEVNDVFSRMQKLAGLK